MSSKLEHIDEIFKLLNQELDRYDRPVVSRSKWEKIVHTPFTTLISCILSLRTKDDVTGPVNIGNPKEFTIKELAELVIKMTGSKSKIIYMPLPQDDPVQRQPDISLANRLLDDWKPVTELEEGLQKTIDYFRETIKK